MTNILYELAADLSKINDIIIEGGGELPAELEEQLDSSGLAFQAKVEGIARWTGDLKGRAKVIKDEITRLQDRMKATQNLEARLKEYVKRCMEQADIKKIEFDTCVVRIQNNPASVEILDEKEIPARFTTIVPETTKTDRAAVLKALKAGEDVAGARLINDKSNLRIV